MNGTIRTIHDAIDTKANRAISQIKTAKSARQSAIEKGVNDKLGITKMTDTWEKLTGYKPQCGWHEQNSPLGMAMVEAFKELYKYDELVNRIQILVEDAHIKVVVGDKEEVLNNLNKTLQTISKMV